MSTYGIESNNFSRKYEFRSVGDRDSKVAEKDSFKYPIGIKTPLEFGGNHDGVFKMHRDIAKQIDDNFKNLILTNHGERLGFYDFGANLDELTHELCSEDGDLLAMQRIRSATSKYMPFITLLTMETFNNHIGNTGATKIGIRIVYNVSQISNQDRTLE